jgi:hypothetical protein
MAKNLSADRSEVYRDHRAQLILGKFLSGEIDTLTPVFDPKHGYTYPLVDAVVGEPAAAESFLNRLYEVGILKREVFDKVISCQNCGSSSVSVRYCCPYCKSFNVKKSSLVEHIQCGYIDIEDRFRQKDKLVCPRCHNELTKPDVNYRKAGVWCACNDCGKNFDIPVTSHFCRECQNIFVFEDAIYRDVYSYTLNQDVIKEAGVGFVLVAPLREFLQSLGFNVESPGFIKGKSGASHMFDIASWTGGTKRQVIAIDLATSGEEEVSEQAVIAMFAKVYDVAPDRAIFVAIPRMSENGRKLAALYKIELVEGRNQKEALKALEKAMGLVEISSEPGLSHPPA